MSVADLLKQHFIEGGPFFMTLHYIMWILVLFFTIRFLRNYYSQNRNSKKLEKLNQNIIFIGVFGLLISFFYRTTGIYGALAAIEIAPDISPALLVGGLRVSLIAPLYAFFLFLITTLIWFIFRNLIKE
jgi:hypothetical protein